MRRAIVLTLFFVTLVWGPLSAFTAYGTDVELQDIQESIRELKDQRDTWWSPKVLVPLLVGLVAAISGWFSAGRVARLNAASQESIAEANSQAAAALAKLKEELSQDTLREARLENHLFESVQLFTGHTKTRSVAIAVIEANWEKFCHMRPTWVSLLVSQAAYLLGEQTRKREAHEVVNIRRIQRILNRPKVVLTKEQRSDLQEALDTRDNNKTKGHDLTPEELTPWRALAADRVSPNKSIEPTS